MSTGRNLHSDTENFLFLLSNVAEMEKGINVRQVQVSVVTWLFYYNCRLILCVFAHLFIPGSHFHSHCHSALIARNCLTSA